MKWLVTDANCTVSCARGRRNSPQKFLLNLVLFTLAVLCIVPLEVGAAGEVDFQGLVLSVSPASSTLTVNDRIVKTAAQTEFHSDIPSIQGINEIEFGMNLRVRGSEQPDSTVAASRIDVKEPGSGSGGGGSLRFTGLVENINTQGSTLTLNGLLIRTTKYTAIENLQRLPMPFNQLQVGHIAKVGGTPLPDGSILAGEIELEDHISGGNLIFDLKFKGTIEAINTSSGVLTSATLSSATLTVSGRLVAVNGATQFEDALSDHIDPSLFAVGQFVEVKAKTRQDALPLAVKIEQRIAGVGGEDLFESEFTGEITSINESLQTMVVAGQTVQTNASTKLLDRFKVAAPFSAFKVGQVVEVAGNKQSDGTVLALRIHMEDRVAPGNMLKGAEIKLRGTIGALNVSSGTLTVMDRLIRVDSSTVILDQQNLPVALSAFAVGHIVEVQGHPQLNGEILAVKVKREDGPLAAGNTMVLSGAIQSIDAAAGILVVAGITVENGAGTVFEDRFGKQIALADLKIGDFITIYGSQPQQPVGAALYSALQTAGAIQATSVLRTDQFFLVQVVTATVTAVSPMIWDLY